MAAEPFTSPERDMNEVAELVTWYVIEEELFHPQKHAHWHATIVALCNSTSSKVSNRTARLLTVVSLLMKLRSKECPNLKTVVNLLGRMLLFPEWEDHVETLQKLYDEAKCQAILMCCAEQQWDKASALWDEYFTSYHTEQHNSALADALHRLLEEKGQGSSRTASKFCADHSFSQFKEEVLEFLYSALPQFGHSTLYTNFRKLLDSHAEAETDTDAEPTAVTADRTEPATTQPTTVTAERTEPTTYTASTTQSTTVAAVRTEPTTVAAEGPSEVVQEEDIDGTVARETGGVVQSDGQHAASEVSDEEDGIHSPEVAANPPKPTEERTPSGDRVAWSSDESSEVHTPPSHLPNEQYVVVRRRESLVAQPKRRKLATYKHTSRAFWDPAEVQNLIKGVKLYGVGRWAKIRQDFEFAAHRTNVDLKDKWRNLQGRLR